MTIIKRPARAGVVAAAALAMLACAASPEASVDQVSAQASAESALHESGDTTGQPAAVQDDTDEYAGCLNDAPHSEVFDVAPREAPVRDFHAREPEELPERFEGLRGAREPTVPRLAVSQEVLQLQEEYLASSAHMNHEEAAELKAAMFGD
jgi:hypothetical protein